MPVSPGGGGSDRQKALALLGLAPGAERAEVRRAYRQLAFLCHPDRHPGRPEMARRFQALSEAYCLLLTLGTGQPAPHPAFPPMPRRGRDLECRLRLDFLEAARGGEFPVSFTRVRPCPACEGTAGMKEGCAACGGKGEIAGRAAVRVRVPPGMADGESLCLEGEGDAGRDGGPAGDLRILLSCGGHPALRRQGLDVYGEVSVPRFRLDEGGPVRVPTVKGPARVEIPPHTRPGRVFRLRGMGIDRFEGGAGGRGDHIVRIAEMPAEPLDYAEKTSPRYPWKARKGKG
ncbi:MAG: J domain-containing protein [Candidatus Tectomicrobia bacterium]|uniref:J domain-containing protein n=1 Tax=Tectimicrobiota bacterium TaxID=2528274 RepID=A0A932I2X8_UNCTE|nr:J domain-containing protein [Candidatus Tectomicrobia bacterium]